METRRSLLTAGIAFAVTGGPDTMPRQIATRSFLPTRFDRTNFQFQTRSRHRAADRISSLQIEFPNYYVGAGLEVGSGLGTMQVRAAVEYPIGRFTPLSFQGSRLGEAASGTVLRSDPAALSIPENAFFFIRSFVKNPVGILSCGMDQTPCADTAHGEAMTFGPGAEDRTMGGEIVQTAGDFMYYPSAIIGPTDQPSVAILGDSRARGNGDRYVDSTGDSGEIARSIGGDFAYINMGVNGESFAGFFWSKGLYRLANCAHCTHVAVELGGADFRSGREPAAVADDLARLIAALPDRKIILSTITPFPPEERVQNARRARYNDMIRAGIDGASGYVEIADVVETRRNSSLWKPGFSDDLVHCNPTGYLAIKAAAGADFRSTIRSRF